MKKQIFRYKALLIGLISTILLIPTITLAQGGFPCADPTVECPLDSWVWFLVVGLLGVNIIYNLLLKSKPHK